MLDSSKSIRCAIYTRKSTEHGLELEFNSLHAQRDACEAYIKSQDSQGWKVLAQHYDDPAYSGGNLDRPALKRLLADVEAGKVDVIIVYKIDRLTRSLADFARLVELFDAKSISFVAVTQQFNTTTSMGRLTLNVLLSFAQFERELSSERVRDKVAASRIKGKWMGGTVPLGYDALNKKLVPNKKDAETVRTIFDLYIKLNSFGALVTELDARSISSRRVPGKPIYRTGARITYGPLSYILKNRVYLGECGHRGKWFKGDHEPIIDRTVFDAVQKQLASNAIERNAKASKSGALLMGKLFDDRGNRMSPSFTSKKGVRYRFYISTALLRGRKAEAGSVARVPAQEIESSIQAMLRKELGEHRLPGTDVILQLDRAVIKTSSIELTFRMPKGTSKSMSKTIEIPWTKTVKDKVPAYPFGTEVSNDKLIKAVVNAHHWLRLLMSGKFSSIESLGQNIGVQPKTIRQGIKCAFLAPDIVETIFNPRDDRHMPCPTDMIDLPLIWQDQRKMFGLV